MLLAKDFKQFETANTQIISGYVWSYLSELDVMPQVLPLVRCHDHWLVHFARHPGQMEYWRGLGWAKAVKIPFSIRNACLSVKHDFPEAGFWKAEDIDRTHPIGEIRL